MSTSKYVDRFCVAVISLTLVITVLFMSGEKLGITVLHSKEDENISGMFTANDLNAGWDAAGACKIILNGDAAEITGNGAYFSGNTLNIVYAGKYVISGRLDGSVNINADGDDKIWLLLDGVDITSETEPPLYINQADKVYLTLNEDSRNTLTFENDSEESETDGCIFSRDDLTVNGNGSLTVTSGGLHGIVCNDTLVFAGGNINIKAKKDAVHAHDGIRICKTAFTVSAGDDGFHAGNDDETAVFYLESGSIDISGCYEGIEANDITIAGGTVNILPEDDGLNAAGSGKTSLITVSGGDITVINKNGRDADGFDSNGSINITGGSVFICVSGSNTDNAVDFGSENGGKFTVSGGTVIACGASQMTEGPDGASAQGFIMETVSGNENDTISVFNGSGKEIISTTVPCSFTSALISSPDIAIGDTVTLKIGDSETEITVDNTANSGVGAFGTKNEFAPGDIGGKGGFPGQDGADPFENKNGGDPSQPPDGSVGNIPGGDPYGTQNGIPSEMPAGDDRVSPQKPGGTQRPDENGKTENYSGTLESPANNQAQNGAHEEDARIQKDGEPVPGNKTYNADAGTEPPDSQSGMSKQTLIMIGVSVTVLTAGLFIAVKKKY